MIAWARCPMGENLRLINLVRRYQSNVLHSVKQLIRRPSTRCQPVDYRHNGKTNDSVTQHVYAEQGYPQFGQQFKVTRHSFASHQCFINIALTGYLVFLSLLIITIELPLCYRYIVLRITRIRNIVRVQLSIVQSYQYSKQYRGIIVYVYYCTNTDSTYII